MGLNVIYPLLLSNKQSSPHGAFKRRLLRSHTCSIGATGLQKEE